MMMETLALRLYFQLRLTSVSRYFFALFDLMNWKDYGIMIWYETLFEIAEGFVFGTYD